MTSVFEVTLAQLDNDHQLADDVVAVWDGERRPKLDVLVVIGIELTAKGVRYAGVLEGAELPAVCFTADRSEYQRRLMDLTNGEPVTLVVWAPLLPVDGQSQVAQ